MADTAPPVRNSPCRSRRRRSPTSSSSRAASASRRRSASSAIARRATRSGVRPSFSLGAVRSASSARTQRPSGGCQVFRAGAEAREVLRRGRAGALISSHDEEQLTRRRLRIKKRTGALASPPKSAARDFARRRGADRPNPHEGHPATAMSERPLRAEARAGCGCAAKARCFCGGLAAQAGRRSRRRRCSCGSAPSGSRAGAVV